MSKIELTEQELFSLMFNMWHESNTIMNHVHCWKIIKDKIQKHKAKDNEVLGLVSKRDSTNEEITWYKQPVWVDGVIHEADSTEGKKALKDKRRQAEENYL